MTQLNLTGTTLGSFTILDELGRGGMAVVYRARQTTLDRVVAIKVLPPELSHDSSYIARFQQEARSVARLEHPHIVPIYEIGQATPLRDGEPAAPGLHFIAMKFIAGRTLKDLIAQEGALSLQRTVDLFAQVADALDYAHRNGVIHRDIKPSNVMVTAENWVYLTDFGLARGGTQTSGLTVTGTVMGTPEYMSPEQAQGLASIGPATDIYALGVVLYEMLTADLPFHADTPMGMLAARLLQAPRPPRDLRGDVPVPVEDVVMRALARKPEARFASSGEMVAELRRAAGRISSGESFEHPPATDETIVVPGGPGSARPQTPAPFVLPTQQPTPRPFALPREEYATPPPATAPQQQQMPPPPTLPPATPAGPKPASNRLLIGLGAGALVLVLACAGMFAFFAQIGQNTRSTPRPPVETPQRPVTPAPDPELDRLLADAEAALAREGGMDEAIAAYQEAVAAAPGSPEALSGLALAYNLRGNWKLSEEQARALLALPGLSDQTVALGHALLADSLGSQGNKQGGLDEAEEAVDSDDELSLAHAVYATLLADLAQDADDPDQLEEALDAATRAEETLDDGENAFVRALTNNGIGYTYLREFQIGGDDRALDQAQEFYERAAELQPQIALFTTNIGWVFSQREEYATAREKFAEALALDPAAAAAQTGIGWTYFDEGDYAQAVEAFKQAIVIDADDSDAHFGLGRALYADDSYTEAAEAFTRAAELNPYDANLYAWAGDALFFKAFNTDDNNLKSEAYEQSIAAYQKAIAIDDQLTFALTGLGWAHENNDQSEEAVEWFERSLAIDDEQDEAHNGLGWALYNLGRYDEAEEHFRRAVDIDPEYVNALYGLGQTLEELGRPDEARQAYEAALEVNPDASAIQEALERLK